MAGPSEGAFAFLPWKESFPALEIYFSYLGNFEFLPNFLVADYLAEKYEVTVWRDVDR